MKRLMFESTQLRDYAKEFWKKVVNQDLWEMREEVVTGVDLLACELCQIGRAHV